MLPIRLKLQAVWTMVAITLGILPPAQITIKVLSAIEHDEEDSEEQEIAIIAHGKNHLLYHAVKALLTVKDPSLNDIVNQAMYEVVSKELDKKTKVKKEKLEN